MLRTLSAHARLAPVIAMALGWLALAGPAHAQDKTRMIPHCLLQVDGIKYIAGRCKFTPLGQGSFILTELARNPYFAYVVLDGETADATWNGERSSTHAQNPLGTVRRKGACWQNRRAKICAGR